MFCKEKHIKVELLGGFGNQLFQLANVLYLSHAHQRGFSLIPPSHGRPFAIDSLGLIPNKTYRVAILGSDLQIVSIPSECKSLFQKSIKETSFRFKPVDLPDKCCTISGYFQSYRYFDLLGPEIRRWINSNLGVNPGIRDQNQVGFHLRLGDMANNPKSRAYHGIVSDAYVDIAMEYLGCDISDLSVVSESEVDARKELPILMSKKPYFLSGNPALQDFRTLIEFPNLIISNSSFSWWAAWLSNARTVAPKAWFSPKVLLENPIDDLIPPSWITL